jgi:hypothetical protein
MLCAESAPNLLDCVKNLRGKEDGIATFSSNILREFNKKNVIVVTETLLHDNG